MHMALLYIAFNKPYGVLSTFKDEEGRPTLADYISVKYVYVAGRLDFKSEGLLLLTNDGELNHRITHPMYEHLKTYLTQVEGVVIPEAVQKLGDTKVLAEQNYLPAEVSIIPDPELWPRPVPVRDYHPTTWLKIILREGKKHQVRRMTASVGYPTLRLVRVAIGSLAMGELSSGDWRWLQPEEVRALKEIPIRN